MSAGSDSSRGVPPADDRGEAFLEAVASGDLESASSYLRGSFFRDPVDKDYVGRDGRTALMVAAAAGRTRLVSLLLEKGASVFAHCRVGDRWTALMYAAVGGHARVLELLLQAGSEPDTRDRDGSTALILAAASFQAGLDVFMLLLRAGATAAAADRDGTTALMMAAQSGRKEVAELLLRARADPNSRDSDGSTALAYAASHGRLELVELLLRSGADIESSDHVGRTALADAVLGGQLAVAQTLLKAGARPDAYLSRDVNTTPAVRAALEAARAPGFQRSLLIPIVWPPLDDVGPPRARPAGAARSATRSGETGDTDAATGPDSTSHETSAAVVVLGGCGGGSPSESPRRRSKSHSRDDERRRERREARRERRSREGLADDPQPEGAMNGEDESLRRGRERRSRSSKDEKEEQPGVSRSPHRRHHRHRHSSKDDGDNNGDASRGSLVRRLSAVADAAGAENNGGAAARSRGVGAGGVSGSGAPDSGDVDDLVADGAGAGAGGRSGSSNPSKLDRNGCIVQSPAGAAPAGGAPPAGAPGRDDPVGDLALTVGAGGAGAGSAMVAGGGMTALAGISTVLLLVDSVSHRAEAVLGNADNCRYLAQRCVSLRDVLEQVLSNISPGDMTSTHHKYVERLEAEFRRALELIERFTQAGWARRVVLGTSLRDEFQSQDRRLTSLVSDLCASLGAASLAKLDAHLPYVELRIESLHDEVGGMRRELQAGLDGLRQEMGQSQLLLQEALRRRDEDERRIEAEANARADARLAATMGELSTKEADALVAQFSRAARIGKGTFGTVFRALFRGVDVAVKELDIAGDGAADAQARADFEKEVAVLRSLRCPRLVQFLGAYARPPTYLVVFELCEGGNLFQVLQNGRNHPQQPAAAAAAAAREESPRGYRRWFSMLRRRRHSTSETDAGGSDKHSKKQQKQQQQQPQEGKDKKAKDKRGKEKEPEGPAEDAASASPGRVVRRRRGASGGLGDLDSDGGREGNGNGGGLDDDAYDDGDNDPHPRSGFLPAALGKQAHAASTGSLTEARGAAGEAAGEEDDAEAAETLAEREADRAAGALPPPVPDPGPDADPEPDPDAPPPLAARALLTYTNRLRIALQVAQGLSYLHNSRPPVIHRDLKSRNVLLDEHFNAKICDFGLSRTMTHSVLNTQQGAVGTPQYMAPEALRAEPLDTKADVYSYGILLYEIFAGRVPWEELGMAQIVTKVLVEKAKVAIPADVPRPIAALITLCLEPNPRKRTTIDAIVTALRKLKEADDQEQARAQVGRR